MLNTYSDRIAVTGEGDCFYHAVRRAKVIIDHVTNEWFADTSIQMLERDELDIIEDILDTVSITLFDALREFKLETSADDTAPEIEAYFEYAEQYKLNREVNALHRQIIDITHRMHNDTSAALAKRREAAAVLPDPKALPILREILNEARGI